MWKAKGTTINFCEMLRVNLHLLRMLQNLMTALKLNMYPYIQCTAVASIINFFHYFSNESSVRP